jgi:dephospho-CoA kinase
VHLFGLTGGIASGKSTVGARFRARGVPVIDADLLAREVVAKGTDGLAAVAAAFGDHVIGSNGELDRAAVAAIVFSNDAARAKLNAITHPLITALTLQRRSELAAKGEPLACYEAALLVENGMADAFRPLVVVSAPRAAQIARAMKRDGATEEAVRKRLAAQMPLATKIQSADIVVENSGSLETLLQRADQALFEVCAKVGVDVERYAGALLP